MKTSWGITWEIKLTRGAFKSEDIHKMHTYRDAIRACRGAYVLYPGSETRIFSLDGARDLDGGVGAIPCAINGENLDFKEIVGRLVAGGTAIPRQDEDPLPSRKLKVSISRTGGECSMNYYLAIIISLNMGGGRVEAIEMVQAF